VTRPRQTATQIKAELLTRHPENIRDRVGDLTDMAVSIREHGILQPLTVTEHKLGGFLILAGHRRYAAGIKAGLTHFPAIIRHDLDDRAEQLVVMLVENTQRRDLDPFEKAKAYKALADAGLSQTDIARRVGCAPSTVNYYVAFNDVDEETVEKVRAGHLSAGNVRGAVVTARQEGRTTVGKPQRGRRPNYFGATHPLYDTVRTLCDHRDGQIIGNAGCGPCWEQAIVDRFVGTRQAAAS
jgi:ParB family chromosome partitioning protein